MREQHITRRTFLAASGAAAVFGCGWSRVARSEERLRFAEPNGGRLRILDGDAPVLTYNFGDQLKQGVPKNRTRSCYCHPVWAPDGTVLTDDFPKDHYHHRGIFWAWPSMKVRGKTVQLWHLQGIAQHHAKWLDRRADAGSALLAVRNDWRLDDGERAGSETVRIRVHKADAVGRAIDFELTFEAIGGPIELLGAAGKGYGGFCFRFAPRTDTVITTEAGKQKDSNEKPFKWADLSARFEGAGEMSGAAVFVNPKNTGAPHGWTLRHYGFLGPSWPGLKPYTLEPGASVVLRYRVYVHRGNAEEAGVAEAYRAYASPADVMKGASE